MRFSDHLNATVRFARKWALYLVYVIFSVRLEGSFSWYGLIPSCWTTHRRFAFQLREASKVYYCQAHLPLFSTIM